MTAAETFLGSGLLLLALLCHVHICSSSPGRGSRCGESPSASEVDSYSLLSRIVGGTTVKKHTQPWIASLKRDGKHFCGGTIVSESHIVTAAHCISGKNIEYSTKVCIGDHDFSVEESSEKIFSIKSFTKHPSFNPLLPINYDIAVLELVGRIKFDEKTQPACLPNPDDTFPSGTLCVALGWGRLQESGNLPTSLQQVALPLINYNQCLDVMGTLDRRLLFETVVCAGFPEGGRDACQGDSGGPFLCQRTHGRWVLVGVTSWGMGCARRWDNNWNQNPGQRGSPAIFTDIQRLLHWVQANLNRDQDLPTYEGNCSSKDGILQGTAGEILLPTAPKKRYSNNEHCRWTILVPKGMEILLTFTHFDLEWDYSCDLDYLAIYSKENHLIGKFCGHVRPQPMLISDTNITLKFISDFQKYSTGFALSYSAVDPNLYPDSDCGSIAVIFEEGEIQTMNHPDKYDSYANCQWVVHGPKNHIIKLTFLAFEVEPGYRCIFDQVIVYHDLTETNVAGVFCGFLLPDPVLSNSNVMQIRFMSDSAGTYIGFKAAISFVESPTYIKNKAHWKPYNEPRKHNSMEHFDKICGVSLVPPRFTHRSITEAEEAIPYSWPWQVSINVGSTHVCSGAIISEKFILTSANCLMKRSAFQEVLLVAAGLHDLDVSENTQKILVKEIFVHPGYKPPSRDFDMALIQLKVGLRFSSYIQPVCLPEVHSKVKPSTVCVVSGWDLKGNAEKSTKLQQLEVPVVLDDVCKEFYGPLTDRLFCAGSGTGKSNKTCPEQSGAPLVCLSDYSGNYFIFGIVSWGVGCTENPKPGLYSSVPLFVEWIEDVVESKSHVKSRHQFLSRGDKQLDVEDHLDHLANTSEKDLLPESASFNDTSSSQDNYVDCKDVAFLQTPGELKLVATPQDIPEGNTCQLTVQAPKHHFIMLHFKQLNMSQEHNSLVIYEGMASNKTFKAQLTQDEIPSTITSQGPALTIIATVATGHSELRLWLTYTFHDQN